MSTPGKIVVGFCIFSTLFMGCYSNQTLSRESISKGDDLTIFKVVTVDGEVFEFREFMGDYGVVRDSVILGVIEADGKSTSDVKNSGKYTIAPILDSLVNPTYRRISIPLSRVEHIDAEKAEVGATVFVTIGVSLAAAAVMAKLGILPVMSTSY